MVPLRVEAMGHYIKVAIGIGRGRNSGDKRAVVKKREQDRELDRFIKGRR